MNVNENEIEVEFITIVEGPTPDFLPLAVEWPLGLIEGPNSAMGAACKLRTLNAEVLAERCRTAWREKRPVQLDYPDGEGGRQYADIVAYRTEEVEQGNVLHLWVSL
jgi:hypothetical protein